MTERRSIQLPIQAKASAPGPRRPRGNAFGFWLRFALALLLAGSLLAALVYWASSQERRYQLSLLRQEGNFITKLETEYLEEEFAAVQTDLLFLARDPRLIRFAQGETEWRSDLETLFVRFAEEAQKYDQIRLLGVDGSERIRVNDSGKSPVIVPSAKLQTKASRYYYQEAIRLADREVFVSPFDLNVEHGEIEQPHKPVIRFLTPVVNAQGKTVGLLAFNYLGAKLLAKMREIGIAFRGQWMLVNRDGQYLQAPNAQQEWAWLLNQQHSFPRDYPEAWQQIKSAPASQFRAGDDLFTVVRFDPSHRLRASMAEAARLSSTGTSSPSTLYLISLVTAEDVQAMTQLFVSRLWGLSSGVMAMVIALSAIWARGAAIRAAQDQQLTESESRLRLMSRLLLKAQEDERRKLSRLLHDEVGQQATAIHLDLRSALRQPELASTQVKLQRAVEDSSELLRRLHEIATDVRPTVLDDLGLIQALETYFQAFEDRTGVRVSTEISFDSDLLSQTVKENLYRIVQEGLANVAKHAKTDEVTVRVQQSPPWLQVSLEDHGVGFDPQKQETTKRLGLLGIRERVELLEGQFILETQPGQGTRLTIRLPLAKPTDP